MESSINGLSEAGTKRSGETWGAYWERARQAVLGLFGHRHEDKKKKEKRLQDQLDIIFRKMAFSAFIPFAAATPKPEEEKPNLAEHKFHNRLMNTLILAEPGMVCAADYFDDMKIRSTYAPGFMTRVQNYKQVAGNDPVYHTTDSAAANDETYARRDIA